MNTKPLLFLAGKGAYREVRERGFDPARIGTIAGASGGAKWLVLSQIDRVLASQIFPHLSGPVHLIGSSIGAWRMLCFARTRPLQAIEQFGEAYLSQTYSEQPSRDEITETSRKILQTALGDGVSQEILEHPMFRLNIMTVRCRAALATETRPLLAMGLMTAAGLNAISRSTLGMFLNGRCFTIRVICHRSTPRPVFPITAFP